MCYLCARSAGLQGVGGFMPEPQTVPPVILPDVSPGIEPMIEDSYIRVPHVGEPGLISSLIGEARVGEEVSNVAGAGAGGGAATLDPTAWSTLSLPEQPSRTGHAQIEVGGPPELSQPHKRPHCEFQFKGNKKQLRYLIDLCDDECNFIPAATKLDPEFPLWRIWVNAVVKNFILFEQRHGRLKGWQLRQTK